MSRVNTPVGLATDGQFLYVAEFAPQAGVGIYTTTGALVNNPAISGDYAGGVALDGKGNLYVSWVSSVGKYTTTGAWVNPSLIPSGYNSVNGIALDGEGHLFWADNSGGAGGNVISEYSTSGQLINASFISGLDNPSAIAIEVPEPSLLSLGAISIIVLALYRNTWQRF